MLNICSVPGTLHILPQLILVRAVKGRHLILLCLVIKDAENEVHVTQLRSKEAKVPLWVCPVPKPVFLLLSLGEVCTKELRRSFQDYFPQESSESHIWIG